MQTAPSARLLKDRARGVLLGQFIGDALGTTVEFASSAEVKTRFPRGLRDIVGGGPFRVLPGQVTDDGELALALVRTLVAHGLDLDARARAYARWHDSKPFDCGATTAAAFGGWPATVVARDMLARSLKRNGAEAMQANGALMRVSPLAIHLAAGPVPELVERAREEARFSHPSAACQAANAVFVGALQVGLNGGTPVEALAAARAIAATQPSAPEIIAALADVSSQPKCDGSGQGWVVVALKNAFHVLLHAPSFEEGLVRTVMAGGDADTNGAIAGALLGAFHGAEAIPARWKEAVLGCRTARGAEYQTTDVVELADALAERGRTHAPSNPQPVARSGVRTSATHPLRVDWLGGQRTPGRVGMTIAPGKQSRSHQGWIWERDLEEDLEALVHRLDVNVLACLLEPSDFKKLHIEGLLERAVAHGLEVMHFAIRDGSVPDSPEETLAFVEKLRSHALAGRNVAVHCEGGLGRTGTICGCYLALEEPDVEAILRNLVVSRGDKSCPEHEAQRRFIRDFAARFGAARTIR